MDDANIPIAPGQLHKKKTAQQKSKNVDLNIIEVEDQPQTAKAYFPCRFVKVKTDQVIDIKSYAEHVHGCSICKIQVETPEAFITKLNRDLSLFRRDKIEFVKLIEYLLPQTIDLEGCEIRLPETAFFGDDGKPLFVAKTDKDGKLTSVNQTNKLQLINIRQTFSNIVSERNRDNKTVEMEYNKNIQ